MDILSILKEEHQKVTALFEQVKQTNAGDDRLRELAQEIEVNLGAHLTLEERMVYPELRDRAEDDEERIDVFEAMTEHEGAKNLLQMLRGRRKPDEQFKAELQVLGENVRHHAHEEETTLFDLAREVMDEEEREELGDKWQRAKQRFLSQASSNGRRKTRTTARGRKSPGRKTGTRKSTRKKTASRR